jgi:polyketide synthase PksN
MGVSKQRVAIIGISGKYPDADSLDDLWENIKQGKDAITEVPDDRWNHALYYEPGTRAYGKSYSKWGGFINGVDHFDPLFFNIAPGVAELLDPQERQFLQCAYHTVEDAGYSYEALSERGPVGVFSAVEYSEYVMYSQANTPVSALNASISNRVSFYCNFTGPSITIDTMCSGSISTVHLACQSLANGECSAAIAGGVNLSLHPNKFILHSVGRYSSTTGRCRSFGNDATGYVASEGVGAVLLKPLEDAIEDGDHIYGVIRSTAINHGGTSRTYTVPKASSQSAVIRDALEKTDIAPVSYIEAHGSGTALGDVIEIDGLERAYGEQYLSRNEAGNPACLVGSIKSNIGHCESAAGIAGLTKVLLQLRYKTIVPSIHSKIPNPHIDFDSTPFEVPHETQPWTVLQGEKRVAGISAFGAGGSNAHMVVEEYNDEQRTDSGNPSSGENQYILLSAKNQERLIEAVRQLLDAITGTGDSLYEANDLDRIAYTLQVGRKHHEQRLALRARSISDLCQKLETVLEHGFEEAGSQDQIWAGEIIKGKPLKEYIESNNKIYLGLKSSIDWDSLIPLWLSGYPVNWNELYTGDLPRRVSLPGYPFAKQKCWVPNADVVRTYPPVELLDGSANLSSDSDQHPLVQRNISDLKALKFSVNLTGDEYFIAQHVVNGLKIMPGVAYLEMARKALSQLLVKDSFFTLKNIVWRRPMVFEKSPREIVIEFATVPEKDKNLRFRIFEITDQKEGDFCRGYAQIHDALDGPVIKDINEMVSGAPVLEITKNEFYAQFEHSGLNYGPDLRATESIRRAGKSIIGQVKVQKDQSRQYQSMTWKPEILDSALHCIMGYYIDNENNTGPDKAGVGPMVPFALASIKQFLPLPDSVWVVLEAQQSSNIIQNIDLSLCDDTGNVCLQMAGYASRVLKKQVTPKSEASGAIERTEVTAVTAVENGELRLFTPTWEKMVAADKPPNEMDYPEDCHWLVLIGNASRWENDLKGRFKNLRIISLTRKNHKQSYQDNKLLDAESYQQYAVGVLKLLQEALTEKDNKPLSLQLVVTSESDQTIYSGLFGMLKTACYENIITFGNLIEADSIETLEDNVRINCKTGETSGVRLYSQQASRMYWKQLAVSDQPVVPWKNDGVYLLTGGFGGLGRYFVEEILNNTESGVVIIWGRGELDDTREEVLGKWNAKSKRAFYQSIDVTDSSRVEQSIKNILHERGHLNAILHAAGVLQDGMIVNKTPDQIEKVFSPKVQGSINLDQATRTCDLDFFALFSSISGVMGSVGQIDYSAANGFMDRFAVHRNRLVSQGLCSGRTLSVNWPLWKDGGMKMPRHAMRALKEQSGLTPLPRNEGLQAFYSALSSGVSQVLVLYGEGNEYSRFCSSLRKPDKSPDENASQLDKTKTQFSERDIIQAASQLLKVPESSIDRKTEFFDIGFDSVTISELASVIGEMYEIELSPTVFYECTAVDELIDYLNNQVVGVEAIDDHAAETLTDGYTDESDKEKAQISANKIIQAISELLKVPETSIDGNTEFFEIGFDSVTISELASVIGEMYRIDISPTVFYECTAVHELVEYLNNQTIDVEIPAEHVQDSGFKPEIDETQKHDINDYLARVVGEMLKVERADIDVEVEMSQLGFDSVTFSELAQIVSQEYSIEVSPTIFYEYETISQLADYISKVTTAKNENAPEDKRETSTETVSPSKACGDTNTRGDESRQPDILRQEGIAIIGMDGRFPGSGNLDQFWENMIDGKDCVTEVPESRWDWRQIYGDTRKDLHLTRSKWGGFIEHVDHFDAEFFGISSYEARQMDPQQRILLQSAWHAIEDAGYAPDSLSGSSTGVYIGIANTSGYSSVRNKWEEGNASLTEYSGPINAPSLGPNRISYFLNLNGPSEPVETACSSSLVAIHRAVAALRSGECDLCIAGGVNVMATEHGHISLSRAGLLSEEGKCKTFAAKADGYVRSEGVGIVLLKRLSDAERDGDNIVAVIRNSKIGYTGKGSAFAAPNTNSQAALIKACYDEQKIDASRVSYIEAQGTGTEIGDAVEFQALTKAFLQKNRHSCAIASVKTHVGHLEVASGMASLIKVIFQIKHSRIVANLHCDSINPHIKTDNSPFFIPVSPQQWAVQTDEDNSILPKIAGINAFGFGGVNAHLIIEEYINSHTNTKRNNKQPVAIVLSAKSTEQVEELAGNLLDVVQNRPEADLYSIAYTLQVGRSAMNERVGLVAHSREDCISKLSEIASGNYSTKGVHRGSVSTNTQIVSILQSDASMQAVIHGWLVERNVDMLTSLWSKGLSVKWSDMYEGETVQRVSLPGYPFKPVRHWVGESLDTAPSTGAPYLEEESLVDIALEDNLLDIFRDVVSGVGNLTVTSELAGFDISSLEMLLLSQKIQDALNLDVSVELLAGARTIRDLSLRITADTESPEPESAQGLVKLSRNEAPGPALICVPAAGAMLTSFYPLAARLDKFIRLYGFGHRGISGSENPHNSIREMAEEYVSQLKPLDDGKAIYLLGHSLGASVVYEMACMLRNQGHSVHLFMLDSQLYADGGISLSRYFRFFVQNTHAADKIAQCRIRGEDTQDMLKNYLINEIANRNGVTGNMRKESLQKLMGVFAHQILMGLDYVPSQKYDGAITLLLAEDGNVGGENLHKTIEKYSRYCLENIRTISVKGGHYSVLAKSNVADLAEALLQTITPHQVLRDTGTRHVQEECANNVYVQNNEFMDDQLTIEESYDGSI